MFIVKLKHSTEMHVDHSQKGGHVHLPADQSWGQSLGPQLRAGKEVVILGNLS